MKKKKTTNKIIKEEVKQDRIAAGDDLVNISNLDDGGNDLDCDVEMGEATESHYSIPQIPDGDNFSQTMGGNTRERSKSPATAAGMANRSSHLVEGRM